ncbi:MAG: RNA-binding domain-containing protein [Candidatus Thorarchaeota archaeon]
MSLFFYLPFSQEFGKVSKTLKVQTILLGAISYSTEDTDLVIKTLSNVLPPSLREEVNSNVRKQRIIGHFGNQIYRLTFTLKKSNASTAFLYILRKRLDERAQAFISQNLEKLYDPKSQEFFLRVSKGRLFFDEIALASGYESPVRIVVKFQQYGGSRKERTKRVMNYILKEMSNGESPL